MQFRDDSLGIILDRAQKDPGSFGARCSMQTLSPLRRLPTRQGGTKKIAADGFSEGRPF